ncbi:Fungal specific transcription factor, putative [Coccidioides posadasii C735 delta SOWgp]|uniref:C6 finger domain transcription factor nscR n=1 Tax=Coccidioides posadasii (strain C735) TaxID=222929 RepID=C5P499_COCP7|nr:Fungal specific transcription factor, putative [Coccidioides posadasii C735 delta SOWgp]EER28517.1 Fungal specific transcription factor, putative [Coccidioides posadasii C735 delta SOWgp]|eukprot:XP_003070662.1 Fungal specific transcription factor, putative [Coccidioides posadasii C735 delta SOWgp]
MSMPHPTPTSPPAARLHSCQLCQQRKVKCDRQQPCSGCAKAGTDCVYRAPAPPRRRKRRSPEEILRARLRRYEAILKNLGVNVDANEGTGPGEKDDGPVSSHDAAQAPKDTSKTRPEDVACLGSKLGRLIVVDGKPRFLENALWVSVGDELHTSHDLEDSSTQGGEDDADEIEALMPEQMDRFSPDESRLLFGSAINRPSLLYLHPEPVKIFTLWQKFLENVDPLTKIFHTPTVQQQVLKVSGSLGNMPKPFEALMFAIYLCAVVSLSDEESRGLLGEPRKVVLQRYRLGAEQALINAEFIKSSDVTVLQAFALYLLAMRPHMEAQTLWILSGVALRIAQRIGLHHDGASLQLSVFETEMRRRLWWQIVVLDGFSAELSGVGILGGVHNPPIPLPLNVNDIDLDPNMTGVPVEHNGITEMSFCLLRYTIGRFLRDSRTKHTFDGSWQHLTNPMISIPEKIQELEDLDKLIEQKFLQYCDISIPFHFIVSMVGRCGISMMKHRVYMLGCPGKPGGRSLDREESDTLFANSIKILEYDNLAKSMPNVRRYYWHVEAHFQWHAFIFLLYELRNRTSGEEVDKAWFQIEKVYENRSRFLTDVKNKLIVAAGNLVLKAWEQKVSGVHVPGVEMRVPQFIETLRARRSGILPTKQKLGDNICHQPNTNESPLVSDSSALIDGNNSAPLFLFASSVSNSGMGVESSTEMQDPSSVLDGLYAPSQDFDSPNWMEWEALFRHSGIREDREGDI